MADDRRHPAVDRVAREHHGEELLDTLGVRMSGSDLTAVMLDVMRRRVADRTPAEVLAQYQRDRFVQPAAADARRLVALESLAFDVVCPPFVPIATAPLAPFGTHSVVAGVHQNRVVTTTRGNEVAADPTNVLALEAAVRRRRLLALDPRSGEIVHLACVDRVVRAQRFEGPRSFAHFSLLGLVSAGRDAGNRTFERESMALHIQRLVALCRQSAHRPVRVRVTDFGGRCDEVLEQIVAMHTSDGVEITRSPDRTAARGYYPDLCLSVSVVESDGTEVELADGGLVDWTRSLVGSDKERLMISGLSLERLALLPDSIT